MSGADGPIDLVEDAGTGDRFLIYSTAKGLQLDIRFEGETLWMTQAQIGALFGRDVSTVSRHIANIVGEGELDEDSNLQKVQIARSDKPVTIYSLDMVISVGYRVSSAQATLFRRWATGILVQYAKAGFVVDSRRLKQPENADRVADLREIIRDIRSDEANVYRELNNICAMCRDYDPAGAAAREFEDQLDLGRLIVMEDARALLDRQLEQLGRVVLRGGGSVSADEARRKAEGEYEKFAEARKIERQREADAAIQELAREAKGLPKGRR